MSKENDAIEVTAEVSDLILVDMSTTEADLSPAFESAIQEDGVFKFPVLEVTANLLEESITQKGITKELKVTEDNYKEIKDIRKDLNAQFTAYEDERKRQQRKATKVHQDFLAHSKSTIQKVIEDALVTIKEELDTYETNLKKEKEDKGRKYWDEKKATLGLDFVDFSALGVKIGINTTDNAIIKSVDELSKPFEENMAVINSHPDKDLILEKYKVNLNLMESIGEVTEEKRIYEEMLAREQAEKERLARIASAQAELHEEPIIDSTPEPIIDIAPEPEPVKPTVEASPIVHLGLELIGDANMIRDFLNQSGNFGIKVQNIKKIEKKKFY